MRHWGWYGVVAPILIVAATNGCGGQIKATPPIPGAINWHGSSTGAFPPIVNQRMTPYPALRYHPNDVITVRAGGCVAVGGDASGRRYVNPVGPDSERLYHGRIWIPGVTPGLVRIAGWQGSFRVPAGLPDSDNLFVRLGYEALNNSAAQVPSSGAGFSGQCMGESPAFVEIQIASGGNTKAPSLPFDLVWDRFDSNFLPIHPWWNYWNLSTHTNDLPDAQADTTCAAFPEAADGTVSFGQTCTGQEPWIDHPIDIQNAICHVGGMSGTLHGHANWGMATYRGKTSWSGWGFDGDSDMSLRPDDDEGPHSILTSGNDADGIEIEFASYETLKSFKTKWWTGLRDQIENGAPDLDGWEAVVTGLVGLDNEHGSHAELHPVFALAMRHPADADSTGDEIWEIFARNWGNEGFCSQDVHYMDLPGNRYMLRLPWRRGDALPKSDMTFRSTTTGKSVAPVITGSKETGVLVAFDLGLPELRNIIEGELRLHWPPPPPAPTVAPPPALVTASVSPAPRRPAVKANGEEGINNVFRSLTPAQRKEIQKITKPLDRLKQLCDVAQKSGKATDEFNQVCAEGRRAASAK
jgi:hypothetical protein